MLHVTGKFVLDPEHNPPALKRIQRDPAGRRRVDLGEGIVLRLRGHDSMLDSLLDTRVEVDTRFGGLGSVHDGCAVLCASNTCQDWARQRGYPRIVAKVVGIDGDEPRYVLLTQPKLLGAPRARHETPSHRREAGLMSFLLIEPGAVECARCASNRGTVSVQD